MLLRSLTLHDFRTYGGRNVLDLTPPNRNKPIILIGGLNGAGKTTILDALQLVLYGLRAKCASRGNLPYKTFLRQSIHRNSDPSEGASIELAFTHVSEGKEREYRVRRTWYSTVSSVTEHVEVEVDGWVDPVLTEQWDERVDDFAPHRISHLFFFDGEKIATMTEEGDSAEVLRTAIHSLLGLELVDRLVDDLEILDRKQRKLGAGKYDRSRSEELERERKRLQSEIATSASERATLNRQLDQAEQVHSQLGEMYRREGGELADQRTDMERQGKELEERRERLRDQLREHAAGALPFAMITDLLHGAYEQAQAEEESRKLAELGPILEERDALLLSRLTEDGLPKSALKAFETALTKDRGERRLASESDPIYNLHTDELRSLDRLLHAELPIQVDQASKVRDEINNLSERLIVLDRRLNSIPEEGDLASLRDRRAESIRLVETLRAKLESITERLRVLEGHLEGTNENFRRELEKELEAAQGEEGHYRKLKRVQTATRTLEKFRARILQENIHRVETAILESFQELIRKPNLVNRLIINPDTFQLTLHGANHKPLGRNQLSAGENQLLAAAILWGLARTAGLPLPVVIDTPLGRLDSKHRSKLVEFYYPRASHQVLLLSTDEEIIKHRFDDLTPYVGRTFLLEYDEPLDRTQAVEGYFATKS